MPDSNEFMGHVHASKSPALLNSRILEKLKLNLTSSQPLPEKGGILQVMVDLLQILDGRDLACRGHNHHLLHL